jgi:hypothetical protein
MAAFTDYKALDFSGFDKAMDSVADKWKRDRENKAILDYIESQGGQKKEGAPVNALTDTYGKTETVAKPSPIQRNPLPKLGVQVAETEEDTQRLEAQMAAGQGAFAQPQPQQPQQQFGDKRLPRGIRNNNPGNIEAGKFAATIPGFQGSDGRFARYEMPEQGIQAADKLLLSYANRGLNTVAGIVNRWAPPSENDTGAYANSVAREIGVDPNQPLDMSNPQIRSAIIKAKIRVENGKQPYGDEVFARAYGTGGAQAQPQERVQMAQAQGGPQADVPAQGAAQAQGFAIPQGMQPASRQNIDVQQLKGLIQAGGEARKLGLALFQQAQTGKNFGFMTGQDGAIYRTNDRTGALERVTEAMKPPVAVSEGQALVDPRTGQVIYQGKEKERAPVSVGEGQSLVDPRTGKIVYQGAVGGKQQQEIAARERIADERGLQGDDRKAFVFNGKIPSQAEKAPTEGQANAALYVDRMKEAEAIISQPGPTGAAMSRTQVGLSQVPVFGNKLVSSDFQRVEQAQRNFINATLRRESGAVISQAEFDNARKQYFPQPDDGPAVLEDKRRNRLTAIQGIENAAGPQYQKRQQQPSRADLEAEARRRGLIK